MLGKILITGASSGIGRSIAIKLSTIGYDCIIVGRNFDRLKSTYDDLSGNGHLYLNGDINDEDFLDKFSSHIGEINGIVHAAGIIKLQPFQFVKKEDFLQILNTNLLSPFFLTQKLFNSKKILNQSSIVFISSISGPIIGSKGNLMYSSSKSAVNGLIKTLALELAKKKIRVNAISAGMIVTELWTNNSSKLTSEQFYQDSLKYPLGYGKPEDIASIVSYLISEDSSWITGSTIVVDGGFTIQ